MWAKAKPCLGVLGTFTQGWVWRFQQQCRHRLHLKLKDYCWYRGSRLSELSDQTFHDETENRDGVFKEQKLVISENNKRQMKKKKRLCFSLAMNKRGGTKQPFLPFTWIQVKRTGRGKSDSITKAGQKDQKHSLYISVNSASHCTFIRSLSLSWLGTFSHVLFINAVLIT